MNTTKSILRKLVVFSVPLILSGLLQQLFNWVDALIVGNIIGEEALAGVGQPHHYIIYLLLLLLVLLPAYRFCLHSNMAEEKK